MIFLCWGSLLNTIAYRLIFQKKNIFGARSQCTHCNQKIAWYDLIPIISWLMLNGKCRGCKKTISWLYPFIELLTAVTCSLLYFSVPSVYFSALFLFFSALIITIRTDFETMLISRFMTLFLIPFYILTAYLGYISISWHMSIIGAVTGFLFLWIIAQLFYKITGKVGMGQGDVELLAFIGSCTGIIGWWIAVLFGSLLGTVFALIIIIQSKQVSVKIPFGPFLAFGAMAYVLFQGTIIRFLIA